MGLSLADAYVDTAAREKCMRMEPLLATHAPQQTLFIEQVPAAIAMFDSEMRYLAVSRRYLSDLALLFSTAVFAPAQVIGRSFHEISPDMPRRWHAIHARALAGEELAQEEELVLRPDGGAVWVRWSMKPWRTVDGRIGGGVLISGLITEQVEVRHALPGSEGRFLATVGNAAVGSPHLPPEGSFFTFKKAL